MRRMNREDGVITLKVVVVVVIVVVLIVALVSWLTGGGGGTTTTTTTTTTTASISGTWGRTPTLVGNTAVGANYILSGPGGAAPPAGATLTVRFIYNPLDIRTRSASVTHGGGLMRAEVNANAGGLATVSFTAVRTGTTEIKVAVLDSNGNWVEDSDTRMVEVQTGVPSQ